MTIDTLCAILAERNGKAPQLSTGGGTSDARFPARYGPVVECGLVGPSMRKAGEPIALSGLAGLSEIYTTFMQRFFAGGPA